MTHPNQRIGISKHLFPHLRIYRRLCKWSIARCLLKISLSREFFGLCVDPRGLISTPFERCARVRAAPDRRRCSRTAVDRGSGRLDQRQRPRRRARASPKMREDLGDHRRIFNACPELVEGAAMIFRAPPQFGQCSRPEDRRQRKSGCQTALEQARPTHARRGAMGVMGCVLAGILQWTRNDSRAQLRIGREHAVKANQM